MFQRLFYSLMVATIALSSPLYINSAWAADDADINAVSTDTADDLDVIFETTAVIDDTQLDKMRGAALDPEILGIAIFDAVSLNNSASGTVSGGNVIDGNAFSDSSGLSTIIQNSGNNVLIQSATILNLKID